MLHAVIMAGGTGTRFWPESRALRPKQLLNMLGQQTMIQSTVDRLGDLVPPERVLVATTAPLAEAIAAQLPQLPGSAILVEPCKRDTAPCVGLAATWLLRADPDATMVMMPSDHVIADGEAFRAAIRYAAGLVEERPERIVTFGIRPTYPAEIFGYIERSDSLGPSSPSYLQPPTYRVKQFCEKPKAAVAVGYLEQGTFYWNSGIFVWKARTIMEALARFEPDMYARLAQIGAAIDTPAYPAVLEREFAAIRAVSIDYAVLEHATDVVVVEASFPWDDVGSWRALGRLGGADDQGNTISARHLGLQTRGTIVRSTDPEHVVVTLGLTDCIVVHTSDATLVANKHDEEAIRQVVKLLEERGWREYL